MKLSELAPDSGNPRRISEEQLTMLKKSLETFGPLDGVVFNEALGKLVGAHQRQKVLPPDCPIEIVKRYDTPTKTGTVSEGYVVVNGERFPYRGVSWDETMHKAAVIAANQHGGEFDLGKVAEWVNEIDSHNIDLDLLGFSAEELANIMAPIHSGPVDGEDDAPEARPNDTRVARGDLWILGNHRLLCGDSTAITDVERLMGEEKAELFLSDPPYGVSYTDKNEYLNSLGKPMACPKAIENDHKTPEEMKEFWDACFTNAWASLAENATYYIFAPQGGDLLLLLQSVHQSGFQLKHILTWVKNNHVLGRCDYHYKHEPIVYGWKQGETHTFYGKGQKNTSVWDFPKPLKNDLHPTMKPIEVLEEALLNSTKPTDRVLDLFGGSGSTLIACEKTNRKCFMIEIDTIYCAVILDRWTKFTGRCPVREDGTRWDSLAKPQ